MRWPRYGQMKASGVAWLGEVPAHWGAKPLKRLVQVSGGVTPDKSNPDFWDGDMPWVTAKDMKTLRIADAEDHVSAEALGATGLRPIDPPASLIVVRGMILAHTFPVAEIDRRVTINQDMKALRPRPELDPAFLAWMLRGAGRYALSIADESAHGTKALRTDRLFEMPVPLPPLDEQRAIAAFLDRETARIDVLVQAKRRLIALLQEKRAALIARAVTRGLDSDAPTKDSGVAWLGRVPAHWAVKPLKRCVEFLNNRRVPLSSEERGGMERNYDYYGASGVIDSVESYLFDEPTILVAEDGANLLSRSTPLAFVATGKYWVNNHAHILRPRDVQLEYLEGVLTTFDFTPFVSGSAQPKLTKDALGALQIPVPPVREQQIVTDAIVQESKVIDDCIRGIESGVTGLTEYRSTLITSAVTGRIDVRSFAP